MVAHIALYATALILFAQSRAAIPTKATEKAPPPCTVSGRAVSAAEGSPLKSARVILMPDQRGEAWKQPQVYSTLSESDGRFTIKNVPAGRYRFSAKHTGYVDQSYQSSGADTGAVLALQAGQEIRDVIFRMTLAAVINGKVSDEDGEPMAGIQVVALHRPTEDELAEHRWRPNHQELSPVAGAQTDDRGQYRLYGLKPGEYYIRAVDQFEPSAIDIESEDQWQLKEALGSEFAPVYYPGVTQMSKRKRFRSWQVKRRRLTSLWRVPRRGKYRAALLVLMESLRVMHTSCFKKRQRLSTGCLTLQRRMTKANSP